MNRGPDPSGSSDLARARARVLELACRLLVRELDDETVEALADRSLADALDAYQPGCSGYLARLAADSGPGLQDAATDFCALFVVSKPTCPYASAWLPGTSAETGAAITRSVDDWMTQLAIELAPGAWGNIPRDHVAVLAGLVALALHQPGPDGVALARTIAASTLGWVPAFADAVCAATGNPLYRAAARMVEHVLGDLECEIPRDP